MVLNLSRYLPPIDVGRRPIFLLRIEGREEEVNLFYEHLQVYLKTSHPSISNPLIEAFLALFQDLVTGP